MMCKCLNGPLLTEAISSQCLVSHFPPSETGTRAGEVLWVLKHLQESCGWGRAETDL